MDIPKSLKEQSEKENRLKLLTKRHIVPLTEFVNQIRIDKGDNYYIPFFDPLDGGINANVLFLLEAPGRNAVNSGFISRNNPDETAKNIFNILEEVDIPRNKTVLWNIIPWYIGNGEKIRPANTQDIFQGWPYLIRLLEILTNVDKIVLVGKKAQSIENRLIEEKPNMKIIECYHPSPMFINHDINNKNIIIDKLRELKKY